MKRLITCAAVVVLGMFFTPLSYAATVPTPLDSPGTAGSSVEYVQLESMVEGAPSVVSGAGSPVAAEQDNPNVGSALSAPAGPQVVEQVAGPSPANLVQQSPKKAQGAVAKIDPNSPRSFVASPITSLPGAISFLLIMALCAGAGVGAAVVVSIITGKKITLGFAGR